MTVPARRETWGELGPAMRALPNDRWRDFVRAYVQNPNPNTGGGKAAAYRAAGMGAGSTTEQQAKNAWDLCQEDRIQAAIAEEARKAIRAGAPEAVHHVYGVMNNPNSSGSDILRAAGMVLARTDPEVQRHDLSATIKIISRDEEELEEYRAAVHIGATREKLMELFGENRLPAIERLDAEERANKAKVVDAEVVEEIPEEKPASKKPARRAAPPVKAEPEIDPDMMEDF
jgi:hypothetical protein